MNMRTLQLLTLTLTASACAAPVWADMLLGPDVNPGGVAVVRLSYDGGNSPLAGAIDFSILAATGDSSPILPCLGCELVFTTGPELSDWNFSGGGSITVTGGVDLNNSNDLPNVTDLGLPNIPQGTLFTGSFLGMTANRCDSFEPGEVCINGTFTGVLDAQLAQIYGISAAISGAFNALFFYVPNDTGTIPGCDPNLPDSCGPFPPDPFSAIPPFPGIGGGNVSFTSAPTPEPSSLFLLAGAVCGLFFSARISAHAGLVDARYRQIAHHTDT